METLQLQTILDALPIPAACVSPGGEIVYGNGLFEELFFPEAAAAYPFPAAWFLSEALEMPDDFEGQLFGPDRTTLEAAFRNAAARSVKVSAAPLSTAEGNPAGRLLCFESLPRQPRQAVEVHRLQGALRERTKELKTVYEFARIIEIREWDFEKALTEIIQLIPNALRCPEKVCVRLVYQSSTFETQSFPENIPILVIPLKLKREEHGWLEVGYFEPDENAGEPPFLPEERQLLDAFASFIPRTIERWQAEKGLQNSQAQLQGIFDNMVDGVALCDETGTLIEWNHAQERLTGLKRKEVLGQPILEVEHRLLSPAERTADRLELMRSVVEQALQTGAFPWQSRLVERELVLSPEKKLILQGVFFSIPTGQGFRLCSITRDVTEKRQMERMQEKLRMELQSLYELGSRMLSDENADHFPQLVMKKIIDNIPMIESVGLFFVDENHLSLQPCCRAGADEPLLSGPIPLAHPWSQQLIDQQKTLHFPISATSGAANQEPEPGTLEEKWLVGFPLQTNGAVTGAIFALYRNHPRQLRAHEIEWLKSLVNQLVAFFRLTHLFKAEYKRRVEAEIMQEIALALASSHDLREIFSKILTQMARVVPYDRAAIFLEESDSLILMNGVGYEDLDHLKQLDFPLQNRLYQDACATLRPVIIANAMQDERFEHWGGVTPIRGWMGVPLVLKGRCLGFLTMDCIEPHSYTEESARIAQALAHHAAVAIENARLLASEQQRVKELEHANSTIAALSNVAAKFGKNLDPDEVMATLGEQLKVKGITCYVALWHAAEQAMEVVYTNIQPELFPTISKMVDQEIIGLRLFKNRTNHLDRIVDQKKTVFLEDPVEFIHQLLPTLSLPNLLKVLDFIRLKPDQLLIALPMIFEGKTTGMLVVWGDPLEKSDEPAFSVFAGQLAIALENAWLYQAIQEAKIKHQRLSMELVHLQENERRLIARELHDEIGQHLTGLKLMLELNPRLPTQDQARSNAEMLATINELQGRVRSLSLDLRPPMLDDLGLLPVLIWHFNRYTHQTQIRVDFQHSGLRDCRFNEEQETVAYRVTQEALTNVARHAGVSQVMVRVNVIDDSCLEIVVQDQGQGFEVEEILRSKLTSGLYGMRERVKLSGGQFGIDSKTGQGTRIIVSLPVCKRGLVPYEH